MKLNPKRRIQIHSICLQNEGNTGSEGDKQRKLVKASERQGRKSTAGQRTRGIYMPKSVSLWTEAVWKCCVFDKHPSRAWRLGPQVGII